MTTISAPAATTLRADSGVRIPPPTINVTSIDSLTALIIFSGTGSEAPEPVSYTHLTLPTKDGV